MPVQSGTLRKGAVRTDNRRPTGAARLHVTANKLVLQQEGGHWTQAHTPADTPQMRHSLQQEASSTPSLLCYRWPQPLDSDPGTAKSWI